mmetsp:Transcript_51183/g.153047  ORF Transcript_51183/g.153047 Transcript_51183/m.153047 type:complete len:264 (+) Transcript_51183:80-871(+)
MRSRTSSLKDSSAASAPSSSSSLPTKPMHLMKATTLPSTSSRSASTKHVALWILKSATLRRMSWCSAAMRLPRTSRRQTVRRIRRKTSNFRTNCWKAPPKTGEYNNQKRFSKPDTTSTPRHKMRGKTVGRTINFPSGCSTSMLASSYTVHSFVRYVGEYTITMDSECFRKAASRRMPSRVRSSSVWWMQVLSRKIAGPLNPRQAQTSLKVKSTKRNTHGPTRVQAMPAEPTALNSTVGRHLKYVRVVSTHATRRVIRQAAPRL